MKLPFALCALLSLTACDTDLLGWDSPLRPTPLYVKINGDQITKDFPPDSKAGWLDGCKSGYAVYGTNMYKTFTGFTRDTTKVGNYEYETEWYNGYNYCRQAINTLYNEGDL